MKKCLALLLCAAMLISPALAVKVKPQDLSQVEVTFESSVDPELTHQQGLGVPSDWARDEVEAAVAAGLVPELTGNPGYQDAITREQFAELALKLVMMTSPGRDLGYTPAFDDCDNDNVVLAAAMGIVTGVGNNKFDPKTTTNREQIATMLCRAIQYIEEATGETYLGAPADLGQFSDRAEISNWAAEGVGLLAANGIMKGTSDTTASPGDPCTVEQSILLVYRFYTKTI